MKPCSWPILLLLLGFTVSGCSTLSANIVTSPDQAYRGEDAKTSLSQIVGTLANPLINDLDGVGVVVGVLDPSGHTHVFGYGHTSLGSDEVPNGSTVFAIGSVTKSVISMVYEKLERAKVVDGIETVGSILSPNLNLSEASKRITLDQLVNHLSGLPRQPNDFGMAKCLLRYEFTDDDLYADIDESKLFTYLQGFDPDPDAVGMYRYSNIGMALLGRLLEIKTHQSLDELIALYISGPLGLQSTSYALNEDMHTRLAQGYVGDSPLFIRRNTKAPLWQMNDVMKGAAGLYSDADDLLKVARYRMAIHLPVEVVPSKGMDTIDPRTGANLSNAKTISLGWDVDLFKDDGVSIIYQHGLIGGYAAYLGIMPEKTSLLSHFIIILIGMIGSATVFS